MSDAADATLEIPHGSECYLCGAKPVAPDGYFVCREHGAGVGPLLKQRCEALDLANIELRGVLANQQHGHDCPYRLDLQAKSQEAERERAARLELSDAVTRATERIRQFFDVEPPPDGGVVAQFAELVGRLWASYPRVATLQNALAVARSEQQASHAAMLRCQAELEDLRSKTAAARSAESQLILQEKERGSMLEQQLQVALAKLEWLRSAFHGGPGR